MADRTIEFDTGLNVDELLNDLKKVEKEIEATKKRIAKNDEKYEYASIKRDEADALGDDKGAEAYAKQMAKAEDVREKEMFTLDNLGIKQAELETKIEQAAQASTKWQEAMQEVSTITEYVKRRIRTIVKNLLVFNVISKLIMAFRSELSNALKNNEQMAKSVSQLKQAFQGMIAPLANALVPVLATVLNFITRIIQAITMLITKLFPKLGKSAKTAAKSAGGSGQLAGFDTIMKLGGSGGSEEEQTYELAKLTNAEYGRMLAIVGLIGAALLAWKLPLSASYGFLGNMALWLTIIAGVVLAIYNYFDMWQNGINLDNLLGVLIGVAGVAFLLRKYVGATAQGVTLLVAGISLLIVGFKDTIENGTTLANTLTVIAGIITAGLGIATLTGNLKILVAAGIMALIFALVSLGGEGQTLVANLKQAFGGLIDFITGVFTGDWEKAWNGIKTFFKSLWNSILAILGGAINAVVRGINWVVSKINSLSFDVPSWVPLIGGKRFGFNIPYVSEWQVPYLAQGAVIPPNRQFMAVLGDQKSGMNIETPLETMIEAFRQAQGEQSINITFNGDLAGLAAILRPEIAQQNKRRGGL